jgi:hypothetical protein
MLRFIKIPFQRLFFAMKHLSRTQLNVWQNEGPARCREYALRPQRFYADSHDDGDHTLVAVWLRPSLYDRSATQPAYPTAGHVPTSASSRALIPGLPMPIKIPLQELQKQLCEIYYS